MNAHRFAFLLCALPLALTAAEPQAIRIPQDPLITLTSGKSLGDNINGPSVIRVPSWIAHPLGRYYMYFAHHKGDHIRLAYADSPVGPWHVYEPGVLNVRETAFYRPQPDAPESPSTLYTHVASPEVVIDSAHHQLVMYVHGMYTDGRAWPRDPAAALKWMQENKYSQYTQTTISKDGLHFTALGGISLRTPYLRVFPWAGYSYGIARLGVLARADNLLGKYELGPNPFDGTEYAKRVRHVALVLRGDLLYVFFSAIGDAPERILLTTIPLKGDWQQWHITPPVEVLVPHEAYDCVDLPPVPSKAGESEGRERALRDPAIFEEKGRILLYYSYCGEQGIAAADVTSLIPAR